MSFSGFNRLVDHFRPRGALTRSCRTNHVHAMYTACTRAEHAKKPLFCGVNTGFSAINAKRAAPADRALRFGPF